MNREEMINMEDYDSLLKEVETNSPYKRLPSPAKKWMSVSEMGNFWGLRKQTGIGWYIRIILRRKSLPGKCGSILRALKNGTQIRSNTTKSMGKSQERN